MRINKLILLLWAFLSLCVSPVFAAEVYFYHNDPSGTPLAITDVNGNEVWRADYKPFGEIHTVTSSTINDRSLIGKELDEETGLYYFGARYMDEEIGRFISPDKVGVVDIASGQVNYDLLVNPQRFNSYAYSLNNPYRFIDIDGNVPLPVILAGAYVAVEVGLTLYDTYTTFQTLSDTNASSLEKTAAIGGLIISGIAPGGGYSAGSNWVIKHLGSKPSEISGHIWKVIQNQMAEEGRTIAGEGSKKVFRDASKWAQQNGGDAADWVKKSSSSTRIDNVQVETHWVENIKTGQRLDFKTKFLGK